MFEDIWPPDPSGPIITSSANFRVLRETDFWSETRFSGPLFVKNNSEVENTPRICVQFSLFKTISNFLKRSFQLKMLAKFEWDILT